MRDSTSTAQAAISIGTYNILNPFHAVKWITEEGLTAEGLDNWDLGRARAILSNLERSPLGICALQELSARTYPTLAQATLGGGECGLSELYTHATREPEGAHGVAVLYRRDRFELARDLELRTPEEEHRSAACVDLKSRETGLVYRVVSVHLKGYDPYETDVDIKRRAQVRGDRELASYIGGALTELEGVEGVFFLGDFNEDAVEMEERGETSRQGQLIAEGFAWSGTNEVTEVRSERQIDWILYRDQGAHASGDSSRYQLTRLNVAGDTSSSDHTLTGVKVERSH